MAKIMDIKRCCSCGRFLGVNAFSWNKNKNLKAGGCYHSFCKKCENIKSQVLRITQPDKCKAKDREQYLKNIEYNKARSKKNQATHKKYYKQKRAEWIENNRGYKNSLNRKRYAMKLNQTPELTKQEQRSVETLYRWAQELPGGWHVDHIIPLDKGGLHHPDNLQVIPAKQNLIKHNKAPEEFYGRFSEFCTGIGR